MGRQNKGEWDKDLAEVFRLDTSPKDEVDGCQEILDKVDEMEGNASDDDS